MSPQSVDAGRERATTLEGWEDSVLENLHTSHMLHECVCTPCAHNSVFLSSFSSLEETSMFSANCRASIYLHSPDTRPAVCQMSRACVSYVRMCISHILHVCVWINWSAFICSRRRRSVYEIGTQVSLPAWQMLALTPLDCSLLIMWAHVRHPAAAAVMD